MAPVHLRGFSVADVQKKEFACAGEPTPRALLSPELLVEPPRLRNSAGCWGAVGLEPGFLMETVLVLGWGERTGNLSGQPLCPICLHIRSSPPPFWEPPSAFARLLSAKRTHPSVSLGVMGLAKLAGSARGAGNPGPAPCPVCGFWRNFRSCLQDREDGQEREGGLGEPRRPSTCGHPVRMLGANKRGAGSCVFSGCLKRATATPASEL